MAGFGDIVTKMTVDKRGFETGLVAVTKDLRKVKTEIGAASLEVARGNNAAMGGLQNLIRREAELGLQSRLAADAEADARRMVMGVRAIEIQQIETQTLAVQRQGAVAASSARAGGGRGMSATGLAYGLSDAATAYQFGGAKGASLAISNNLPQIGQEVASAASKFALAGGTLGRVMGGVARFAGPVGLVASVGLPLLTLGLTKLYSTLTEGSRIAESLETRTDKAREKQGTAARLGDLRSGEAGALESQKADTQKLRDEIAVMQETRQSALTGIASGLRAGEWQSETQKDDLFGQAEKAAEKIRELQKQLKEAERFQREGEAGLAQRRRTEDFPARLEREQSEQDAIQRRRAEYYGGTLEDRRRECEGPEIAERERMRNIDEQFLQRDQESIQRSVLTGLDSKLGSLRQQRDGLSQPRRSFNLPELATRGNSIDKQIGMGAAKGEAVAESQRKMQIEKLDKMIDGVDKLIEAVRSTSRPLKPAGI
ncbi:MAG: hypothetical protein H0T47_08610 [Planctomycetaceae bacterium]|nr:hypothetical protein [Planctomycetaceae bacterium]